MPITATESTFELVTEGIHEAMFSGWEEADDRGFGPGLKLIWNLINEPDKANGDSADIWQFTSQKLSKKSAIWGVLKGLGNEPTVGAEYEDWGGWLDPCVGTIVNLVVKHEDGPNGPRAKVKDVLPSKRK